MDADQARFYRIAAGLIGVVAVERAGRALLAHGHGDWVTPLLLLLSAVVAWRIGVARWQQWAWLWPIAWTQVAAHLGFAIFAWSRLPTPIDLVAWLAVVWLLLGAARGRITAIDEKERARRQALHEAALARKREGGPEPVRKTRSVGLRPVESYSSWWLACTLAHARGFVPPDEDEVRAIRAELDERGKTPELIDEMVALARWADGVINSVNGCTEESGGTVRQIVADSFDLNLALELAEERDGVPAAELEPKRAFIAAHVD
jgi:hypothetical protein